MIRRGFLMALLLAITTLPASANLVVNGGFESLNVGSIGIWGNVGDVIGSGWILGGSDWNDGNQPDLYIYNNVGAPWGSINPAEGNQFAMLPYGNHNAVEIHQSIPTEVGKSYTLRFAAKQSPGWNPWGNAPLRVRFGDLDEVISMDQDAAYVGPWDYYERTVTATSAATELNFQLYGMEVWLDDVSVTETTLPPAVGVLNGGFESPAVQSLGYFNTAGLVIGTNGGWTVGGSDWDDGQPDLTLYSNVLAVWGLIACPEGDQFLMMPTGNHNAAEISQYINTVPGTQYKLRFAAKSSPNNGQWTNAEVKAIFGTLDETFVLPGTSWGTATDPNSWNYFERTVTADSTSTLLNFKRWTNEVWLDDVSVTEAVTGPTTAGVTFTPYGGTYTGPVRVIISCATPGATIRYTTDGTQPTESNGTVITSGSAVTVSSNVTLKAKAWSELPAGDVTSSSYTINPTPVYNRPATIQYDDNVIVDGDFSDWDDAQWVPLDKDYDGIPWNIVEGSAYAAKWGADGTKVYVAVKVNDTDQYLSDSYLGWNAQTGVEIYIHASSNTGEYANDQDPAQQYIVGITDTNRSAVWTSIAGKDIPDEVGFKAEGHKSGDWLYYEVEITPYEFFSLTGNGLVTSTLQAGRVIGLDVVAVGNSYELNYTGMKSENMMLGKGWDLASFGKHLLTKAITIGDVKNAANGASVSSSGIVSAVFTDVFYIQSADRAYGIRVNKVSHGVTVGQIVNVSGTVGTLASGERFIAASSAVASGNTGSALPIGLTNKSLGGGQLGLQQGVAGASGLSNIGLLVKTTGKVTTKDTSASPAWFKIDDGSGVSVKVFGTVPSGNPYVSVTGASSCEIDAGIVKRVILATSIKQLSL